MKDQKTRIAILAAGFADYLVGDATRLACVVEPTKKPTTAFHGWCKDAIKQQLIDFAEMVLEQKGANRDTDR